MPGKIDDFNVPEGTTVGAVLQQAGLDANGFEIRLDGQDTTTDTVVRDGQTILLVRKVKGN
jgi:sulfur carrier protein ThiS